MSNTQSIVLIVHTLIALAIIVLVLLQRGKGATAGAAFGAGASGTVFGARGSSSFFSRATAIMATAFFASSLALAYLSSQSASSTDSLLETAAPLEETQEVELPPAEDALPELMLDPAEESAEPETGDALPELELTDEATTEPENEQ